MNESIALSAMHVADKVNRFVNARYYSIQLAALEKSAANIGCGFVQRGYADTIPSEVEEHLAIAVLLAREAFVAPELTTKDFYSAVEARLREGYAIAYFKEIVAALDALGLRFQVQEQGINWDAMKDERRSWKPEADAGEPLPLLRTAGDDGDLSLEEAEKFVEQFLGRTAGKGSQPS